MTRKASKTDWAERKVAGGFPYKQVRPQDLILARDVIKLLRAERQRAVRACQRLAKGYRNEQAVYSKQNQTQAEILARKRAEICDDCATAIGGGK